MDKTLQHLENLITDIKELVIFLQQKINYTEEYISDVRNNIDNLMK